MHFLMTCWGNLQFSVKSQGLYTSCDTHLCLAGMPFAARTWPSSLWEWGWEKLTQSGWRRNASSLNYHFMAKPAPLINQAAPGELCFHHSPTSTDPLSVYLDTGSVTMATMVWKVHIGGWDREREIKSHQWVSPAGRPRNLFTTKGYMGVRCVYIRPKTATHLLEKKKKFSHYLHQHFLENKKSTALDW